MTGKKKEIKLPESFVKGYANKQPDWGPLGWITYKRTYARWADDSMKRREEWHETVRRVVEGNINIDPRPRSPEVIKELTAEAKEMFDTIFNFAWTPPGRGLWIMGTEYVKKHGDAAVNCWAIDVKPGVYPGETQPKVSMPFVQAMDFLMKGGGVGFNVTKESIMQIPRITTPVQLTIVCDIHHANVRELKIQDIPQTTHTLIRVEDTRQGWIDSLRTLIDAHFKAPKHRHIVLDVSDIRPYGSPIKGFGGVASGPGPLVEMLRAVNGVMNDKVGGYITSVDATDMMNFIGRCIVSGGVRRSSLLSLGDGDDLAFIGMKLNDEKLLSHRWASNNSILVDNDFDEYDKISEPISVNGEPGIVNLELCRNRLRLCDSNSDERNANIIATNPCSEIALSHAEPCNLAEIYPAIVERKGYNMEKILRLALRYTKRITCLKYDWDNTQEVISKNRRVGVSLSGLHDLLVQRKKSTLDQISEDLDNWYKIVRDADAEYSKVLKIPESVAVSTNKPSGSVSLLTNSSPGIHAHQAPYYIRRIRFQEGDPILDLIRQCGFKTEQDAYSPNTIVTEFPVKVPNANSKYFRAVGDLTLEEQFKNQAAMQEYWADNSVSATLTFKPNEKRKIAGLLKEYSGKIKSTSLLPYTSPGEKTSYTQMPYEPITKEEYEEQIKNIEHWPHELHSKLKEEQDQEYEIIDQEDCEGGACPIK